MSDTVSLIAAAMRGDADALRAVSQNIANAESVAYRRRVPVAHASFADVSAAQSAAQALAQTSLQAQVQTSLLAQVQTQAHTPAQAPAAAPAAAVAEVSRETVIDHQPGTLRRSGEPLHVAIEGPGFFTVSTPNGEAFTRRGDFRLDAQGVLVTASGSAVLGEHGPILIGDGVPAIDADGTVRVRGEVAGRLRIVEMAGPTRMQALGDGSFAAPQGAERIESGAARLRQGFLETSNVSAVGEMIRMMEIMRHFEATQRLARSHDDMLTKAISQLGRT